MYDTIRTRILCDDSDNFISFSEPNFPLPIEDPDIEEEDQNADNEGKFWTNFKWASRLNYTATDSDLLIFAFSTFIYLILERNW